MPHFRTYDEAELAYRTLGPESAPPLVCLAGGPGRDAAYLGDLGGLGGSSGTHRLVIPDARGTGDSPVSADPDRYAFPSLAEDIEALRDHLGLERFTLLAHDAGATTAQAYAVSHPQRLAGLVLVCPGAHLQGELDTDALEIFESRSAEPWWPEASAAVRRLAAASDWAEIRALLTRAAPMAYAHWDAPQRAHAAAEMGQLNPVPRAGFWQGVDEPARLALLKGLDEVRCPVLTLTGELDAVSGVRAGEAVAESFPHAEHRRLTGVGHYPWVDAPTVFRAAVTDFVAAL
ncbi:MAG TPA: alpha/beta hydrolase [Streptomyces sp.]|nr:alpha/beta hydrolase [Streptomyces sp.]